MRHPELDSGSHNSGGLSTVIQSRNDGKKKVKEILNSDNSGEPHQSTYQNDRGKWVGVNETCHPEMAEKSIERSEMRFLPCSGSQKTAPSPAFQAPSPSRGEGKAAFTLAEVLITLGIIGVVVAMTMPTLMAKYQEKVTVNKMKKMYSVLSQAYSRYKIDNTVEHLDFDEEGAKNAFEIFKPYLKVAKDCGTASGKGCFYTGMYKKLSGADHASYDETDSEKYYKILLADGASLLFRGGSESNEELLLEIFYDTNGEASPNTWGKDLFEFDIIDQKIIPNGRTDELFQKNCLASDAAGWGCSGWVVFNGNMDYLHCKDLSLNGKTECK